MKYLGASLRACQVSLFTLDCNGGSPLHAVYFDEEMLVQLVNVFSEAQILHTDHFGRNFLHHLAVLKNVHFGIISDILPDDLFLKLNTQKNKNGKTPNDIAIEHESYEENED